MVPGRLTRDSETPWRPCASTSFHCHRRPDRRHGRVVRPRHAAQHADRSNPVKAQTELTREYNQHRKRELEELRAKSAREADALAADKLRPAERRAAEKEAGAIVKGLLKRP